MTIKKNNKKVLVIPIEIQHRELNGACSLILEALENNWTVYVGQKQQIWPFINYFKSCVWYLKSIVPGELETLKQIKNNNNFITSLDVEGLILSNGEYGVKKRYSEETLGITDILFFWGNDSHKEPVEKIFPKFKEKFYVTGSPIVDFWNIKNKKFKTVLDKKRTILISVNFDKADPKFTKIRKFYEKFYSQMGENSFFQNQMDKEFLLKKESYEVYKDIIPKIAKRFSNYSIIVRPHPEENINFWKNHLKSFKNIYISNIEDTSDHLLNCDVFIHFNSTMSVQSNFFKKYTIMYNPIKKIHLNEMLSEICLNISKVVTSELELFNEISNKGFSNSDISKYVEYDYEKNENNYSSKKIINIIETKSKPSIQNSECDISTFAAFVSYIKFKSKIYILYVMGLISILIPFLRKRFMRFRFFFILGKRKWKNINSNDLEKKIRYVNVEKYDLSNLMIKKHYSGLFKINK